MQFEIINYNNISLLSILLLYFSKQEKTLLSIFSICNNRKNNKYSFKCNNSLLKLVKLSSFDSKNMSSLKNLPITCGSGTISNTQINRSSI